MLASDGYRPNEIITGKARRGHWSVDETLRILEETSTGAHSGSAAPRRRGSARDRWRRPMAAYGAVVAAADGITGKSELDHLEERVRKLECQLGRKTLKVDFPKEALSKSRINGLTLLTRSPLTRGSR